MGRWAKFSSAAGKRKSQHAAAAPGEGTGCRLQASLLDTGRRKQRSPVLEDPSGSMPSPVRRRVARLLEGPTSDAAHLWFVVYDQEVAATPYRVSSVARQPARRVEKTEGPGRDETLHGVRHRGYLLASGVFVGREGLFARQNARLGRQ